MIHKMYRLFIVVSENRIQDKANSFPQYNLVFMIDGIFLVRTYTESEEIFFSQRAKTRYMTLRFS